MSRKLVTYREMITRELMYTSHKYITSKEIMKPKIHPTTNTTAAAAAGGELQQWNSPVPYLFGGIALVIGLIAIALMIIACSHKNSSTSDDDESSSEKSEKPVHALRPEMEPRIVVIMAGETNPTYLAKPIAAVRGPPEEV
ncbi:hypothetical protein CASFOL_015196 [Castilleja foliolosa]|uniref:Uncharacterized protein n=1 Tax=Castilleja foliolosa TaxID=1961234 RepID=A0ABD3DD10_9LAMI